MKIQSPEKLLVSINNKTPINGDFENIDFNKLFQPEHLSQLYHTPYYGQLTQEQQKRYNQLFALRSNEQIMSLEAFFIAATLKRVKMGKHNQTQQALLACMEQMAREESQHYQMFLCLNNLVEPEFYNNHDLYFARLSPIENLIFKTLPQIPGITLFLLWVVLMLEEFSTYVSRETLRYNQDNPGVLEPNFVAAHREHLRDEIVHVSVCANLIELQIQRSSKSVCRFNRRLLKLFMSEYLAPKRGGIKVLRRLVKEFPELETLREPMTHCVRRQRQDKVIWEALHSPSAMPVNNELLNRFPMFRFHPAQ